MSYQGHIQRGVVVFDEPVSLPDGTEVVVEAVRLPGGAAANEEFWRERSLEELIAEQGVAAVRRFEDVLGQGATLWSDDAEFDDFLRNIHDRRREGIRS